MATQRWFHRPVALLAEASSGAGTSASLRRRGAALAGAAAAAAWALEARRREAPCRCESRAGGGGSVHLWFVRHGETENNVLARQLKDAEYEKARSSDPPLSALGHEQVRRVARHPALAKLFGPGKPPVDLYASPLVRAVETAAQLQCTLPGTPPIRLRAELTEVGGLREALEDGGHLVLPGMTPDELQQRFPDLDLDLSEVPSEGWWAGSPVEDKSEAGRRAIRERVARVACWARELRPTAPGGRHVVVIGHGALLNRLLVELLGVPQGTCAFLHGNTAVTHLEFRGDVIHVHCVNSMPIGRQPSESKSASAT